MRKTVFILLGIFILVVLLLPSVLSVDAIDASEVSQQESIIENQENREVVDVKAAFNELSYQGEWLGFHIGPDISVEFPGGGIVTDKKLELFPKPFNHHIQGMARSPRTGRSPVFYFTHSGKVGDPNSFPGLMVVEMNSLATHGERLGSNRLKPDGEETVNTTPPDEDKVIKIFEYDAWHPSGIAMVGDILAVPRGGAQIVGEGGKKEDSSQIKIIFYDATVPTSPVLMDYELIIKSDIRNAHLLAEFGAGTYQDYLDDEDLTDHLRGRLFVHGITLSSNAFIVKYAEGQWVIWSDDIAYKDYSIFLEEVEGDAEDRLVVYDAQEMPPWRHGAQAVAITRIDRGPDNSFFLLVTNTGKDPNNPSGEGAHFHWSNSGDFNDANFRFSHYQQVTGEDLMDLELAGYWPRDKPIFQNLNFVNEKDGDLFLIGSLNTHEYSPTMYPFGLSYDEMKWFGDDRMYLLRMENFNRPNLNMFPYGEDYGGKLIEDYKPVPVGVSVHRRSVRSPGRDSPGGEQHVYKFAEEVCLPEWPYTCSDINKYQSMRWQANFTAGASAYVSPLGELLYYGVSHWADGNPGNYRPDLMDPPHNDAYYPGDFAKVAEFSHREMTAVPENPCGPIYLDDALGTHITLRVGADPVVLSAENFLIEPWVRMYQKRNREKGQSVTMDWRAQSADDYDDFNLLDGTDGDCKDSDKEGFADCMSSMSWCLPQNAELTIYDNKDYGGDDRIFSGSGKTEHIVVNTAWESGAVPFEDKAESVQIIWQDSEGNVRDPESLALTYEWDMKGVESERLVQDPEHPYLVTYTPGISVTNDVITMTFMGEFEVITTIDVGTEPPSLDGLTGDNATAVEGQPFTLNGTWSDQNNGQVTLLVNWGDGTTEQQIIDGTGATGEGFSGGFAKNHVYVESGSYKINVGVHDDEVAASAAIAITVANIAPLVEAGVDQFIDEGGSITLDPATFSDDSFDFDCTATGELAEETNFSATVAWGDGTEELSAVIGCTDTIENPGVYDVGTIQAGHTYADNGSYTVEVCVLDDDYAESCDSFTAIVANIPPEVIVGVAQQDSVDEGAAFNLAHISFTDPGFDCLDCDPWTVEDFTATVDWGDGTTEPEVDIVLTETSGSEGAETTGSVQASHHYADNGIYTVEVCVQDDEPEEGCAGFDVTVDNVAPVVDAGQDQVIFEGDWVTLDPSTFSDPGFDCPFCIQSTWENFTPTVDWGDDHVEPLAGITLSETVGSEGVLTTGTIAASHQYLVLPGVKTVTVCVEDDDGAQTCDTLTVTVVHGFMRFCAYADDEHHGLTLNQESDAFCSEAPWGVPGEMRPSGVGSRGDIDINDRVNIEGVTLSLDGKIYTGPQANVTGSITAGDDVNVGKGSKIFDSITSGHIVEVKQDAAVVGDIIAADLVKIDAPAVVTGTVTDFADVPAVPVITWENFSATSGVENVTLRKGDSRSLPPNEVYGDLKVSSGVTLTLQSGQYAFRNFTMEKGSKLLFDLSDEPGTIVVDVAENLLLKRDVQMAISLSGEAPTGTVEDVLFLVGRGIVDDKTSVQLQGGGTYLGTYLAPYITVKLGDDATLDGALYGRKVNIEKRVTITGRTARDLFALLFVTGIGENN